MIILELNKIELDYCVSCKGIWLDAGELELILEDETVYVNLLNKFNKANNSEEEAKPCPICAGGMDKVVCLSKEGNEKDITIDQCKDGHGLWFDQGELKEIINNVDLDEENKIIKLMDDMFFLH